MVERMKRFFILWILLSTQFVTATTVWINPLKLIVPRLDVGINVPIHKHFALEGFTNRRFLIFQHRDEGAPRHLRNPKGVKTKQITSGLKMYYYYSGTDVSSFYIGPMLTYDYIKTSVQGDVDRFDKFGYGGTIGYQIFINSHWATKFELGMAVNNLDYKITSKSKRIVYKPNYQPDTEYLSWDIGYQF